MAQALTISFAKHWMGLLAEKKLKVKCCFSFVSGNHHHHGHGHHGHHHHHSRTRKALFITGVSLGGVLLLVALAVAIRYVMRRKRTPVAIINNTTKYDRFDDEAENEHIEAGPLPVKEQV